MPFKSEKQRKWMHANEPEMAKKWEKKKKNEAERDYKDEYKKFQSSTKAKKYRAELNKYNRKKGTYGNGDGKDASHKGGKIVGFESQSKNRGRAEKSRLKKEELGKRCTVKEVSKWLKTLEEFRYRKVRNVDARRVASFVNNGMNEEELPKSLQKKWEHKKYGREKHLATKYVETVLNVTLKESVNEAKKLYVVRGMEEFTGKEQEISTPLEKSKANALIKTILKQQKQSGMDIYTKMKLVPVKESVSIKESATDFWMDMFRPGPIPNQYINQLIKKKGMLPSKSHIKRIYRDNGNPKSTDLAKAFKQLSKEKYIKKQGSLWKWESGFAWESVNEGKKRYYQQDRVGSAKYTISYHDGKKKHKDGSDFFDIKIFRNKKDLAKFVNTLSKSGYVYGFNESVNEGSLDWEKNFKWANEKELKVIAKVVHMSNGIAPVIKMSKKKDFKPFIKKAAQKGLGESINETLPNRVWMDLRKQYSANELKRFFETKDHEGKMAKSQLERSMKYSKMIYNMIQNADIDKDGGVQFPAWVQSYLTKSEDYLQSVFNYLDGKDGLEDKFQTEFVNERISVSDERHFGKKGIIIMIDDNGKKVSAIFKDKKNANKFNRNKPADIKKLLQLAKKTKYPKAIDESVNEAVEPRGNIKKVLDVAKNKQAKKIGGTLVDLTTAGMMTQVWDKVNDSSKEKMNRMNTKQLINLILKLWKKVV